MKIEQYLSKSLMQSSVESYLYDIEKYKKANKNADKYDYQKVMQYMEQLRNNHKVSNVKRVLASIKKYYDYLIETGKRKDNPVRSIKLRDGKTNPIQLQDLFTEKELQSLLKPRVERYPFLAKRNKIIMSLLVYQGLRIGEIENIKLTDVDLEKANLQIQATGITNARNLPLKAEQILLLYQYINHDRNELKTFRNDQNALLLGKLGTPIRKEDVDYLKGTSSRLSIGAGLTRNDMLQLALMASENRAASALAHSYPGGRYKFVKAMNAKAVELGLINTHFVDHY